MNQGEMSYKESILDDLDASLEEEALQKENSDEAKKYENWGVYTKERYLIEVLIDIRDTLVEINKTLKEKQNEKNN